MIKLSVGKPYPLPLQRPEGAAAHFLTKDGNLLQIAIPGITREELFALKKGKVTAGFLYENGDMTWLFTFYDKKGPVFTLDAPFDIRLYPRDIVALHNITNQSQRLNIEIHVVDENSIVRALRMITMPNTLTIEFLSAVQEQMATNSAGSGLPAWLMLRPDQLTKKAKMYELGK